MTEFLASPHYRGGDDPEGLLPVNSLFLKTYLSLALLIVLTFLVVLVIADLSFEKEDFSFFTRIASADARLATLELAATPKSEWDSTLQGYQSIIGYTVSGPLIELPEQLGPIAAGAQEVAGSLQDEWVVARKIPDDDGYLLVTEGELPITTDELLELFLPLAGVFVMLGIAIARLARRVLRPVRELSEGTQGVADGDLSVRVRTEFDQPFRTLATRFNTMTEVLQAKTNQQQLMISAIPHELRTPLARVRFALDRTRSVDDLEQMHEHIESIDKNLDQLEKVIEDTLELSRLQSNAQLSVETVNISELAEHAIANAMPSNTVEIQLYAPSADPISALANERLMGRALANLVNNAVRYAKHQVGVTVSLPEPGITQIVVEDDGPGIPDDQVAMLFRPFTRLDDSRSRNTGGVGLGLALVDHIIRAHAGTVGYQTAPKGGSRFTLRWSIPTNHL